MARLGLGSAWQCAFANEWCEKKAASYGAYFGGAELKVGDVAKLTIEDLPGVPELVWASFPCQDLSLAGNGAGLAGERSGTFKPFWKLMRGMVREGRCPQTIVLENVVGALSSDGGRDFATIVDALAQEGYQVFVAVDTKQAVERMREDHLDVVLLDPQFDQAEQGGAFVVREVNVLRPAQRRRLFFVMLSPSLRNRTVFTAPEPMSMPIVWMLMPPPASRWPCPPPSPRARQRSRRRARRCRSSRGRC